ncbi:MAG: ATP phosphoribosyltransferase regulatory subunit [Clostridia bacterium]|nr:ATP phosphoribosyltransferase regulatory subunit [Clostridia bacterium]
MMDFSPSVLDGTEKLIYSLRDLYVKHGYKRYKMSKFEEYALYGRNIDFLVSEGVITFTDTDGKLMALKPDVTLSIVKNAPDDADSVTKLCYNESVYRVSKGTGTFREITQAGLECIGCVTPELVGEVLSLAAESLALTGRRFVLEVSHLGLTAGVVNSLTDDAELKSALISCAGEKNVQGMIRLCRGAGISDDESASLVTLVTTYGTPDEVLEKLSRAELFDGADGYIAELRSALGATENVAGGEVLVDFSVTADVNYYNGVVFKGFVEGAPRDVLSGGQYDRLMKKMGKRSRAVGFAVYLDALERLLCDADGREE